MTVFCDFRISENLFHIANFFKIKPEEGNPKCNNSYTYKV